MLALAQRAIELVLGVGGGDGACKGQQRGQRNRKRGSQ